MTITFYFDHFPGLKPEDVYVMHRPLTPPRPGETRYRVTVTIPDGCTHVDTQNVERE